MRSFILLAVALALAIGCWRPDAACAATSVEPAPSTKATTPGVELANAISIITGAAISPLLGVSAVGAWRYFHAQTPQQLAKLPWFAQPWFWIPAFVLVLACFLKDTLGIVAPRLLKKPLDVADAIGHKINGLIAVGAFVPLIIAVFPSAEPEASLFGQSGFLATIDLSWLGNGILVPVAMLAFFLVFLASNAINVLILLSPFAVLDAALKGFRLLVLLTVTATAFVNPWLGAVWALIIIGIAYFIAGWSFRLSHFGFVFIWDFVTLRRRRFLPDQSANRMFLARQINKVPARSYGKLLRDEKGNLVLKYHPWLVLPERVLVLPEGRYAIGKGLFYSQIMKENGQGLTAAMLLPPRYRGHEEELVPIYGLAGVRDAGLRAAFRWLKDLLGFSSWMPSLHEGVAADVGRR
jgi:MFS family permease